MTDATLDHESRPWYQQGWPWLLIAPPASAVVGGILTIIIAVNSPNALVVDDYYKQGLAINQEKHRVARAAEMHLTALVRGNGKLITVSLDALQPVSDTTLNLQIAHVTRSELDRALVLERRGDSYQAALADLPAGTWYLRLQDSQQTWELRSRLSLNGPFQTYLKAED
jgi:hypothetical protein